MSDTKPEEPGENLKTATEETSIEAANHPAEASPASEEKPKAKTPRKRTTRKTPEKSAEPESEPAGAPSEQTAPKEEDAPAPAEKPKRGGRKKAAAAPQPEQEEANPEEGHKEEAPQVEPKDPAKPKSKAKPKDKAKADESPKQSPEKPEEQEQAHAEPAETKPQDNAPTAAEKPAAQPAVEEEKKKPPRKPQNINVNDLLRLTHDQILKRLTKLDAKVNPNRSKIQLMLEILRRSFALGDRLEATGIFTYNSNDGSGVLLFEEQNFAPTAMDIYVSQNFIQRYKLKPGLKISARLLAPKEKDKRIALDQVLQIEGQPLEEWKEVKPFDQLTPLFPKERIILETKDEEILDGRVIDLVAPLGKGQRGLIIAPPRVGKTILLKHIAQSITQNHPEIELLILLVDERPEEVTDMKREVKASVYSSTFDEGNHRHIQIAELVLERAKRLVELGKDVVILLDSLTRLARGYNNQTGNKGRLLSGGIDPKALQKAGRFFSVARNAEEGGSLTLLASVLVDTGSKLDQVIYEEFKGKGNMDILLDRMLVEKRIYPGIHIVQSGTRKEDFLYHPDELQGVQLIRKQLAAVPVIEAMETLQKNILRTSSNAELILRGLR